MNQTHAANKQLIVNQGGAATARHTAAGAVATQDVHPGRSYGMS